MTEHFTVYFRNANGVHAVKLPATEALRLPYGLRPARSSLGASLWAAAVSG